MAQSSNCKMIVDLVECSVSWMSHGFQEEDERVWIQGHPNSTLRMVSIRIMRGNLNYKEWIHALFVFDAMLSGQRIDTKITKSDIRCSNALISGNDNGIHEYIVNSFWLYCQNKTTIAIFL